MRSAPFTGRSGRVAGLRTDSSQARGEAIGAGSVENEAAKSDQNEGQENVPVAPQRLAQRRMPDQPQGREAPKKRERGEDCERRAHFPRPLGREDRRIGGYVVASIHDRDGRDLENSDGRWLCFFLDLPKAQQLSYSDDDGRTPSRPTCAGRDRQSRRRGRQADRDNGWPSPGSGPRRPARARSFGRRRIRPKGTSRRYSSI